MIPGINRLFEHDGKKLRIECEDLGDGAAAFEVRVVDQGSLLWQKRFSYRELLERPAADRERELRAKIDRTILTVEAAIAKGKLGG